MKIRSSKSKLNNLARRKRKINKKASNNNSQESPSGLGHYNLAIPQKIAFLAFPLLALLFVLTFNPDKALQRNQLFGQKEDPIEYYWKVNNPLIKTSSNRKNECVSFDLKRISQSNDLHKRVFSIVKNTNMEIMADEISKKNKAVAGFLVGIAMKESKFGTYAPKKNGRDCFNYWGYRGMENTTKSGYSCFDSPKQAISVVSRRIEALVNQGANTPASMIVWKCGSTCDGHSEESVNKWISDVGIHYYEINNKIEVAKLSS